MDRATSDQTQGGPRSALVWTRTTPGRAALLPIVIVALAPLSLIVLRAPSWAASRRHQQSWYAEPIKLRTLLIVDTTSDEVTSGDGLCSLREAITTSNDAGAINNDCGTGSGFDTIHFNLSGTIVLKSALPAISQNLIIDGTGQTILVDGQFEFQVFAVSSGATLAVNNLTVENGSVSGSADGGAIANSGTLAVTNSLITGSMAGGSGGGVNSATGATMTLMNSTISSNSATFGGGIFNSGTLTVTNSTVSGNSASIPFDGEGGGILNFTGTMTVTNSTISGNAAHSGGGIFNESIAGSGATMTATNSTIAGNFATVAGGIANDGTMTVINSTVWGSSGGGIFSDLVATLKNTIVANSVSGGNCSTSGTFTSDGHNLSDDNTCNVVLTDASDQNNTPAGLDPSGLKNNGGPTQTIALLPTSPAVDAIPTSPTNSCTEVDGTTPITTDQRGNPRPDPEDSDLANAACDIGAFESSAVESSPTPTATATGTPTATATVTPTPTLTATGTATATVSATPTRTATPTATPTATATETATNTATATPTTTATATPTATATATPTPVPVTLRIKPKALKFPKTTVGTPSKPKNVKVSNPKGKKKHPGLPVLIEMISDPAVFTETNNCPASLAAGSSCAISVTFTPSAAGAQTGILTIMDNAHGSTQMVRLSGTGK